jgi:tetratricopeptide (TPR) repeat protein
MVTTDELERALREALPADQHGKVTALAGLIADAAGGAGTHPPVGTNLAPALQSLAGREIRVGSALVSFGADSQIGDITIGDVAGGDIIRVSLAIAPDLRGAIIGKNIIQIGRLMLPMRALLALLGLLLVGLATAAFALRGPTRMTDAGGTFNLAVADFVLDAGNTFRRSSEGQRLSKQVYTALLKQPVLYQELNSSDEMTIWHDGLSWREKGASIGFVPDEATARARLAELGADVLLYGSLDAAGRVTLRFYVSPRLKTAGTLGELAGDYQLGEPIRPDGTNLTTRASALFWLIKGLEYDSQGRPADALDVLNRGEAVLRDWGERDEGKEILYFFQGQAGAFVAAAMLGTSAAGPDEQARFEQLLDAAAERFQRARDARPGFLRPVVGLGSVALLRSQCGIGLSPCPKLPEAEPGRAAVLGVSQAEAVRALQIYEQALVLAPDASDRHWADGVAPMAVGSAYLILGQIAWHQQDSVAADRAFAKAVDKIRTGLPAVAGDHRALGQAYHMLGVALLSRSMLSAGHPDDNMALLRGAQAAFTSCASEGGKDALLAQQVAACKEFGVRATAALTQLEESRP